jgi:hypothetical protein
MAVLQRLQVGAVLDLENLLHMARRTSGAAVRAQFLSLVALLGEVGDVRHAVGCCDRWLAGMLAPVAGAAGVRVFPGPIGADRADGELLRRAVEVPGSVDAFVVGSGDRVFAPLVAEQALAGRHTVVIGRPGAIASAVRAAAHEVIELPLHTVDLATAA